jgi:hypothetical protein
MQTQPLTINVPSALFTNLQQRAAQSERSVEEETLEALATSVSADTRLPEKLAREVSLLASQADDELREIAQRRFPVQSAERLEALHAKRAHGQLSTAELDQLDELVQQYERHMLLRAQAVALLRERGHNVSAFLRK